MESSSSFNIHTAAMREAVWFESYFKTPTLRKIRKVTQWIFWFALVAFFVVFLAEERAASQYTLGVVFLTFSYGSAIFILERFGESLQRTNPSPTEPNLAEFLSFEASRAVAHSFAYAEQKRFLELTSSVLLYFLLKENPSLQFVFQRALLDVKEFGELLQKVLPFQTVRPTRKPPAYSVDFQDTISQALISVEQRGRRKIEMEDLLAALAAFNPLFKKFLIERKFSPERDIANLAEWHWNLREARAGAKKFWLMKNLRLLGTVGKDWAAGYSITLDRFSYDLSRTVTVKRFPRAVGHEREKESIERTLSRRELNNVLLVGNPGSGRRRLIEDLATRAQLGESKSDFVNYKKIVELDVSYLLSSIQSLEEAEAVLVQAFREVVSAGNIILVIDELHNFVGEGFQAPAAGRVNIASVLSPYLKLPDFPFIAMTTFSGLHRYIEPDSSLLSLFEKVEVPELSADETLLVLEKSVPSLEHTYKKFISYPALQTIVAFSDKYIQAVPFPKKAIDLLDDAMGFLAQKAYPVLLPEHIAAVLTERTQIPVGEIETKEKEVLLDLEQLIHARIIDQEEAVEDVASALRRGRTEISTRKGPLGSFLFLGPTGVGKTETAKALAAIYFGSESRMIRLDMSEFQQIEDIDRLLGSSKEEGLLTTAVRENPFSLLLLDELEKAHPNILNLFLQVLDEAYITDGLGRKVDFRHTMIIATSNAGYQLILQALKEKADFSALKERMLDYLFEQGIYRPEFLNRFDGVVLFKPLSPEHLLAIAELMLSKLKKNLKEKGIDFVITQTLKEKIVELGYNPVFGARNMRRVIQDKVEDALATSLLKDELKRGDRVEIDPAEFSLNIQTGVFSSG